MPRKRYYTPEENTTIIAAKREELDALAERLGRTRKNIQTHQRKLLNPETNVYHVGHHKYNVAPKTSATPAPFARPAWFDENLESISRSK